MKKFANYFFPKNVFKKLAKIKLEIIQAYKIVILFKMRTFMPFMGLYYYFMGLQYYQVKGIKIQNKLGEKLIFKLILTQNSWRYISTSKFYNLNWMTNFINYYLISPQTQY